MKCFLIRDLIPFYAEGQVSKETKEIIELHFKECEQCRELYSIITESSDEIKESVVYFEENEPQPKDNEIWRKYYGSLYIRGIRLFFVILALTIQILKLIKRFG